jgi:hypothetical protein
MTINYLQLQVEKKEKNLRGMGEGTMLAKISPIVDFLSNGWLTNDGIKRLHKPFVQDFDDFDLLKENNYVKLRSQQITRKDKQIIFYF